MQKTEDKPTKKWEFSQDSSFSNVKSLNLNGEKFRNIDQFFIFFFDIVSFAVCLSTTKFIRYSLEPYSTLNNITVHTLWPLVILLTINWIAGLYDTKVERSPLKSSGIVLITSSMSFLLITFIVYLLGADRFVGEHFGRGILLGTIGSFTMLAILHRFLINSFFQSIKGQRRYLVVADIDEFNFLSEENKKLSKREQFDFFPSFQSPDMLLSLINKTPYVGIIIGMQSLKNENLINNLMKLRLGGFYIFKMNDFFESVWFKVPVFYLQDQWFAIENGFNLFHDPIALKIKRGFDILLSLIMLTLTAPLMLATSLLIKITDWGPIIYSQKRTGKRGKVFTIYKFRSMKVNAELGKAQWARKNDSRVTPIGKLLRTVRIDELPQLWNVLKGDMSFIGPRPERPEFNLELQRGIPYYNFRHLVKPGLTGWAQVLYPYGASTEDALEKLQYDFYYIKNYNLLLDLSIVIKTIRVVLFGKGGR